MPKIALALRHLFPGSENVIESKVDDIEREDVLRYEEIDGQRGDKQALREMHTKHREVGGRGEKFAIYEGHRTSQSLWK